MLLAASQAGAPVGRDRTVFLAWRDLRAAKGRFVLVGSVMALIALMSTLLSGLATGLVDDGISGLRSLPLTHLAYQPGAGGAFARSTLDDDHLGAWQAAPGIEAAPIGVAFFTASTVDGANVDLALFGLDPDSFLAVDLGQPTTLADGTIVLSESVRPELPAEVGELIVAPSDQSLAITGFVAGGSYGHQGIGFTSLDTWRQLVYGSDARERYSAVAVRADGAGTVTLPSIDAAAGTETVTKQDAYRGSPGYVAETATLTLIRGFLVVISSLVVGAFFTVWTVQRSAQIGLMKALGASNLYVVRDALGQLVVVMVLSTALGVGAAIGLGRTVGSSVPFSLQPQPILISAGALIGLGLAGCFVALGRITSVDPLVALKDR